jgi:hypothetical protein
MIRFALLFLALPALAAPPKPSPAAHYAVREVPTPAGVDPQIGGLCALPDGRIAACFHRGEVGIFDPVRQEWSIFAEGLHEPLGLLAEADGSLLVMQRPELTRLRDTDGDGKADLHQTVWDGFGLTGNYHEFNFGPARGPDGRVYLGFNTASNGAGVFPEVRGEWSAIGVDRARVVNEWGKARGLIGRMYARVPYRGCVVAVDPVHGRAELVATGFRSPDGVGFDAAGRLLVSDNQGDWRGTSELFVVRPGGFYGHPASLVWRPDWDGREPLKVPVDELNRLRTPAAVWFPHENFANSPTEPVAIPRTPAWGAFGGQTLIGEMNNARLLRLMIEEVDGVAQGAAVALLQDQRLKNGLHRLLFRGDDLWIGRTHLSWAGGEGLAVLTPTGAPCFDVADIRITPEGFRLRFTRPLAPSAAAAASWKINRFTYHYHAAYGSPRVGQVTLAPTEVRLSAAGDEAALTLPERRVDHVHEFDLSGLADAAGERVLNPRLAYTVRRIPSR